MKTAELSSSRISGTLEHAAHGRVRLRLHPESRTPQAFDTVRRRMEGQPGVRSVEVNPRTGSVLIHAADGDPAGLREALADVVELAQPFTGDQEPRVEVVVEAVRRADRELSRMTGGKVNLRVLVPTLFLTLAVRELLRQGLTVGSIPWYVLAYYGVDSFLKLFPEHGPRAYPEPGATR